jgi:hypothetical protein
VKGDSLMKALFAIMASILSAWMFYFLVEAFFIQFEFVPIFLAGLAALILFLFSSSAKHVMSRLFFILAIESFIVPLAALLHSLNSEQDFLQILQKESQKPEFIIYLISGGWDTEILIMVALAFTLVFSLFSFFTSPERDKVSY